MRFEIFPDDLDATVDLYMRVLRFRRTADQRDEPGAYVSLQRAVWKAWDTISRHKLEIKDPVGTAFDCLNRAAAVEDHVEALLARISAEHELSEDDIDARGGVRKGFQILRGAIKKNEPLE